MEADSVKNKKNGFIFKKNKKNGSLNGKSM